MPPLTLPGLLALAAGCVWLLIRGRGDEEEPEEELREAYRAANLPEAHIVAGLMRQAGLTVMLRNASVMSAAGELPMHAVLPSLWVRGELDYARAREIVSVYEARLADDAGLPDWRCRACGELSPGNFEDCWRCRVPRSAT